MVWVQCRKHLGRKHRSDRDEGWRCCGVGRPASTRAPSTSAQRMDFARRSFSSVTSSSRNTVAHRIDDAVSHLRRTRNTDYDAYGPQLGDLITYAFEVRTQLPTDRARKPSHLLCELFSALTAPAASPPEPIVQGVIADRSIADDLTTDLVNKLVSIAAGAIELGQLSIDGSRFLGAILLGLLCPDPRQCPVLSEEGQQLYEDATTDSFDAWVTLVAGG